MSCRTQVLVAMIIALGALASASAAFAGNAAESNLNQSLDEYYKKAKSLGKDSASELLKPAQDKFVETSRKQAQDNYSNYLHVNDPRLLTQSASPLQAGPAAPTSAAPAPIPEETIDASGVPSELDFPGASKSPTPSPRPKSH